MTNDRGQLIAIEGISGAGKSSVLERIKEVMESLGYETVVAGGYKKEKFKLWTCDGLGEFIERLIKKDPFIRLPWLSETYLLMSYLALHVEKIIKPSLTDGKIVFYEHYLDSIGVYQLARAMEDRIFNDAKKLIEPMILYSNKELGIIEPNIHIYLEVKPQIAIKRYENRENRHLNQEDKLFIKNIHNLYRDIISKKDYIIESNEGNIKNCVKDIVGIIIPNIRR